MALDMRLRLSVQLAKIKLAPSLLPLGVLLSNTWVFVKPFLSISILLLPLATSAQPENPCQTQRNTLEINECARITLAEKDKALNAAYQKLLKSLVADDKADTTDYVAVRRQLLEAQRAWITYRDNDCRAKYTLHETGTIRGAVFLSCLIERTEQRTRELGRWVEN